MIKITGTEANRDVVKKLDSRGNVVDLIPQEIHYYIVMESSAGKFKAEVSESDYEKHVVNYISDNLD